MEFRKYIEKDMDKLASDLQGCIRIASVYQDDKSGCPYGKPLQDCLDYMLGLARGMGFETVNMDGHLGWCEYGSGEEMVAVLGHLDVVPEGDGWTVPPYEGLIRDGRIYGRGTMDDKGPTVAALYALKAIKESGVSLKRRIRIIFGLNEETGSADMKYYREHGGEVPVMGFTPDGEYPVINGEKGLITESYRCSFEQSGPLFLKSITGGTATNIVPAHAEAHIACDGAMSEKICAMNGEGIRVKAVPDGVIIEASGISAHGAAPQEGINANGRMACFLSALPFEGTLAKALAFLSEKIGTEWDGKSLGIAMSDEESGPLTNNFGIMNSDGSYLEVKLNYRYPVTKSYDMCGPQLRARFEEAGFVNCASVHKKSLFMPADSELVQKLMAVYKDYTGQDIPAKSIGGGTYAKMLPNVLAFGPIFPGDEVREHKPDEFMELSRLMDNAIIIANSMYSMAGD